MKGSAWEVDWVWVVLAVLVEVEEMVEMEEMVETEKMIETTMIECLRWVVQVLINAPTEMMALRGRETEATTFAAKGDLWVCRRLGSSVFLYQRSSQVKSLTSETLTLKRSLPTTYEPVKEQNSATIMKRTWNRVINIRHSFSRRRTRSFPISRPYKRL